MPEGRVKWLLINGAIAMVTLVLVGTLALYYTRAIERNVQEETQSFHEEIAYQSTKLLREKINSSLNALKGMASVMGSMELPLEAPELLPAMREIAEVAGFQSVAVVDNQGRLRGGGDVPEMNISGRAYFNELLQGRPVVSDLLLSGDKGVPVLVLGHPISSGGEVTSGVLGRFYVNTLDGLLTNPIFRGEGYAYLVKSNGTVFAKSNHPQTDLSIRNMFQALEELWPNGDASLLEMKENMSRQLNGEIRYRWNNQEKIMVYTPVGINDWFLLSVLPEHVITRRSLLFLRQTVWFCCALFVVFSLLAGYLVHMKKKNRFALDGMEQELRQNQERYQLIMEQIQDIIFEWNIPEKTAYYTEHFRRKFGYDPSTENFPDNAIRERLIHKDDVDAFQEILQRAASCEEYAEVDLRIRTREDGYMWCRFRLSGIRNGRGKISKVIGLISDVDKQKRATEVLRESATKDSLTGLLNRGETVNRICAYLEAHSDGSGNGAFMMIDIDNFKLVNDTMGHGSGDDLLRAIGESLAMLFRESDVIGRVGGDEFVVFMVDIRKGYGVSQKAKEVVQTICDLTEEKRSSCAISCSLGVSLYPRDGDSYKMLLLKADEALYYAKNHGKNQYRICEGDKKSPL